MGHTVALKLPLLPRLQQLPLLPLQLLLKPQPRLPKSLLLRLLPKLPLRLPKRKETAKEKETKTKATKVRRSESAVMRMLSDTTVKTPLSELVKLRTVSQNGLSDIWATALGRKITSF